MSAVEKFGSARAVAKFRPDQTRMKVGAVKGAIGTARKIKDWKALDRAIDELIAEQQAFVAWWDAVVTPLEKNRKTGRQMGTSLSADDATVQTGISKQQVSRWRDRLADEPEYREWLRESSYDVAWAVASAEGERGTLGTTFNEWFTPQEYIALARQVLGEIDLDPASHPLAQQTIRAAKFFTRENDGLKQKWAGRVWLNPPFAREIIPLFMAKLIASDEVTAAIALTHNYSDTDWFQQTATRCAAVCFTRRRINFVNNSGEIANPTQGQTFFYFGNDPQHFRSVFSAVGVTWLR
jgi:hypothetical protein